MKAQKRQRERERKDHELAHRKHLANVRVVQKNLVYIIGLPARIAAEEVRRIEWEGMFAIFNQGKDPSFSLSLSLQLSTVFHRSDFSEILILS